MMRCKIAASCNSLGGTASEQQQLILLCHLSESDVSKECVVKNSRSMQRALMLELNVSLEFMMIARHYQRV